MPWERTWVESEEGGFQAMLDQLAGSLKAQASRLVPLVREAEEKERIEYERLKVEHEAWQRRRAIEEEWERLAKIERTRLKAIQDSKDDLRAIMDRWVRTVQVQGFLGEVGKLAEAAPPDERKQLAARLGKMQKFLGTIDVLELIREWKLPEEG